MDKMLFVANWKSHKFQGEGLSFISELASRLGDISIENKEIVVAPPFTLLAEVRTAIDSNNFPIQVAGQNISPFPEGAYTGEISAGQLRQFAGYVIVGHSERRTYFHEAESDIENKIREAKAVGLRVIQCIQDANSLIHNGAEIVAYEPPSAIGSGNPDDPQHVGEVFEQVRKNAPNAVLLYGGSVKPENIGGYKQISQLGGFLIGGASLDVESFISLLS